MGRREVQNRSSVVSFEEGCISEKRDYYDVLGVEKSASAATSRTPSAVSHANTIPTGAPRRMQRTDSKRFKRPTPCSRTTKSVLNTTGLGTAGLKVHRSADSVAAVSTSTSKTSSGEISSLRFLAVALADGPHAEVLTSSSATPSRSVMCSSARSKRSKLTFLNHVQHAMVQGQRMAS